MACDLISSQGCGYCRQASGGYIIRSMSLNGKDARQNNPLEHVQ